MSEPRIYHTLGGRQLRHWLSVEIADEGDTKKVTFVSQYHVGNRFPVSWSYATTWTDQQILDDSQLYVLAHDKFGKDFWVGSIRI